MKISGSAHVTGTHNLCFGAKIRRIGIPLHTPVLLYKSGYKGIYITWTCYPDVLISFQRLQNSTQHYKAGKVIFLLDHASKQL